MTVSMADTRVANYESELVQSGLADNKVNMESVSAMTKGQLTPGLLVWSDKSESQKLSDIVDDIRGLKEAGTYPDTSIRSTGSTTPKEGNEYSPSAPTSDPKPTVPKLRSDSSSGAGSGVSSETVWRD